MLRVELPQLRNCGECVACCQIYAIPELDKPGGVLCKHACKGCNIYPTRPKMCREFRCHWLNGYFKEEDRPDKLGVVFSMQWGADVGMNFLLGTEYLPQSIVKPRAMEVAGIEATKYIVVLKQLNETTLIKGPPKLKAVTQKLFAALNRQQSGKRTK
jgi:Fe-S-cluster containining protein